jgi:S1-C subfamily serine protease
LRLSGACGLIVAPLGNSSTVNTGDSVLAIGNAGGSGGTPSTAAGTVTGLNQSITAQDQSTESSEQLTGLMSSVSAIRAPLSRSTGSISVPVSRVLTNTAIAPASWMPK